MSRSAADRKRIARTAALHRSATEDTTAMTAPARAAFLDRFRPADPGLTDEERERRARAALREYMSGLSAKAARARSQAAAAARDLDEVAADLDQLAADEAL